MELFKDKVAIVTGGASGIGRALCEELGKEGTMVVVADVNATGAKQVSSAVSSDGGQAHGTYLDVSQADDVQSLVDETASKHGRLDFMFNNAGIVVMGEVRDMSLEHWIRHVSVNLLGVIHGTTAAYSLMVGQGFGHIVNTASLAGLTSTPTLTPYTATKHAVVGLSTALRAEGVDLGVRVSVVCPGFVQTGMLDAPVLKASINELISRLPARAILDPTKAARIILKGVARNRPVIVFPFYARILWWLHRLHPAISAFWASRTIRDFRTIRE
ncbi:MAG: SDR family oxidoreductase [Thermodesulfobacteriota bacterium]|nr:SDR family oxidoreductase [Thermodesulfobacteriota bacterium]